MSSGANGYESADDGRARKIQGDHVLAAIAAAVMPTECQLFNWLTNHLNEAFVPWEKAAEQPETPFSQRRP